MTNCQGKVLLKNKKEKIYMTWHSKLWRVYPCINFLFYFILPMEEFIQRQHSFCDWSFGSFLFLVGFLLCSLHFFLCCLRVASLSVVKLGIFWSCVSVRSKYLGLTWASGLIFLAAQSSPYSLAINWNVPHTLWFCERKLILLK